MSELSVAKDLRSASSAPTRSSLALVALLCSSCTSLVTPPKSIDDPTSVFILREARHVGVVLPLERDGRIDRYVEYGFGDWAWYALGEDRWYDVFATVLWPTRGALSRREFGARTPKELPLAASWVELDELVVSHASATLLLARLESDYERRSAQAVVQPSYQMTFVPLDESYWLANTCADVAGRWLRELDCDITAAPIRIRLQARAQH